MRNKRFSREDDKSLHEGRFEDFRWSLLADSGKFPLKQSDDFSIA